MHCSLQRNFGNKMAAPIVLHPQCRLSNTSRPLELAAKGCSTFTVQKLFSSASRATRRWPTYFCIMRSLPARPELDNTFWTAKTQDEILPLIFTENGVFFIVLSMKLSRILPGPLDRQPKHVRVVVVA